MLILNIIPAPTPKKAISYDYEKDEILIERADVIGLIEVENPDNSKEIATLALYMSSDDFGVYVAPQMSINFLEFIEQNAAVDLGKYKKRIAEIKKFYEEIGNKTELVEVEQKGNVSHIKRIIRKTKKDESKNDS